jgi:hypothetical protein
LFAAFVTKSEALETFDNNTLSAFPRNWDFELRFFPRIEGTKGAMQHFEAAIEMYISRSPIRGDLLAF